MIVKLLGFADLLALLALILVKFLPEIIVIVLAFYLIIKGLFFVITGGVFPSFFDILSGIYLIIAANGIIHWIPTTLVVVFLLQKAFFSLV